MENEGLGSLRRLAVEAGALPSQVAAQVKRILDGEETKDSLIDSILARRAAGPQQQHLDAAKMALFKPSELLKRARLAGVPRRTINSFIDEEISSEQLIAAILECAPPP